MAKNTKQKRYSSKEKAAYWAGAGIAAITFGEQEALLDNKNMSIASSAQAGFRASRDKKIISKVFKK